jgi:hypothetical protein
METTQNTHRMFVEKLIGRLRKGWEETIQSDLEHLTLGYSKYETHSTYSPAKNVYFRTKSNAVEFTS